MARFTEYTPGWSTKYLLSAMIHSLDLPGGIDSGTRAIISPAPNIEKPKGVHGHLAPVRSVRSILHWSIPLLNITITASLPVFVIFTLNGASDGMHFLRTATASVNRSARIVFSIGLKSFVSGSSAGRLRAI